MSERPPHGAAFGAALMLFTAACDEIGAHLTPDIRPSCGNERMVEEWAVTAGIATAPSGGAIIKKWEVRRNFSPHFGLRIVYDTSEGATPFLQIWHDYKSGEFMMRLGDGSHFRLMLKDQYAVSSAAMPPAVFDQISRYALRIEHTSNTNKWSVYETTGLPEAIAAAKEDLEAARLSLARKECKA